LARLLLTTPTTRAVKDYSNAVQGFENKAKSLMIPGVGQGNDSTVNSINDLISGLNQNRPGALFKATQHLAASNSADTVTFSTGAVSALATGSAATAAAALMKKEYSDASASDSGASIAPAILQASDSQGKETKASGSGKVSGTAPNVPGANQTVVNVIV
jgi:hypothetical protein